MSRTVSTPLTRAIRAARGDRTRAEFHAATGIPEGNLYRYETGRRVPLRDEDVQALEAEGVPLSIMEEAAAEVLRRLPGVRSVTIREARA